MTQAEIDKMRQMACVEFPVKWKRPYKITGRSRTYEYQSWVAMKSRCLNKKDNAYPSYGGRGIAVDPAWLDFNVFLTDMGPRPLGHTLDRKDGTLGYSKSNCRWATPKEQANNRELYW